MNSHPSARNCASQADEIENPIKQIPMIVGCPKDRLVVGDPVPQPVDIADQHLHFMAAMANWEVWEGGGEQSRNVPKEIIISAEKVRPEVEC